MARLSTNTVRRALDIIDETDEDLALEGSRRSRRRAQRREARRRRRSQRKQNRRTWREGKREGRQDRRDEKQDRRLARREVEAVTRDQANPERARRGALPPPEAELQPEYEEGVELPEEELEEVIDEDAEDIADVADDMAEQAVLSGARRHLRKIRHDALSGDLGAEDTISEVGRVRRGVVATLRRQEQGSAARRQAIKRRMKTRLQDETAGFSGRVGCAACTEAYRQARLAGVEMAEAQAQSDLGRDELGFVKKAAKGVARGLGNLKDKLKRDPSRVAERRERRAGQAAQAALSRAERRTGRTGLPEGAWGTDVQVGPDLMMRTVQGRQGAVLELRPGLWLVASLEAGQAQRDPQGTRRAILRDGQAAIGSKLGPMAGLLQLTGS